MYSERPMPSFTDWKYLEEIKVVLAKHPDGTPIKATAQRRHMYSGEIKWWITYSPAWNRMDILASGTAPCIRDAMNEILTAWKKVPPF